MRALIVGWPSFQHGEATAGDLLSMRQVGAALTGAGIASEMAFSPGFLPNELRIDKADPNRYSHLLFVCGPLHGWQVRALHSRFRDCRRIAVGVSVIDPADTAVTGFHRVLARDGAAGARPDLALSAKTSVTPVIGVIFAPGQREYGERRRHDEVHRALGDWLTTVDCARIPLDTRLDTKDWRHCATADQFTSVLSRLDALVTTRLHGLVLGLRAGIPVLAVDPVHGGGKVSAQGKVLDWPAVLTADDTGSQSTMDEWWSWCQSEEGRRLARERAMPVADPLLAELVASLR